MEKVAYVWVGVCARAHVGVCGCVRTACFCVCVCVCVLLNTEIRKKEKIHMNGSSWPGQLHEKLNWCDVQSWIVLYILGTWNIWCCHLGRHVESRTSTTECLGGCCRWQQPKQNGSTTTASARHGTEGSCSGSTSACWNANIWDRHLPEVR